MQFFQTQQSSKSKFPRAQVIKAVKPIFELLKPHCERIQICGSLRRGKRLCSDAEILFVPKFREERDGLFEIRRVSEAHACLDRLLAERLIEKRKNSKGFEMWGDQNMLGRDCRSGIPVDFFSTTQEKWWVALVIRTGGKITNLKLTTSANRRGLTLHAYGEGFTRIATGEKIRCASEEEVFKVAGLDYLPPHLRA